MSKVFIAGGATLDSIIYLNELPKPVPQTIHKCGFNETVGSTGVGKALNLGRLGMKTTLHAMIGNDVYGERIRKFLENEPIEFMYDIDPAGTERHVNLMDDRGGRISIFVTNSTPEPIVDISRFEKYIKDSDFVVLNIISYTKRLIPICKQYGREIWTDLHDYNGKGQFYNDFIDAADYIFMSSDNLPGYRRVMEEFIEKGKKLVVCTHGKDGATALPYNGQWIEAPIVDGYDMKDTNGAGDSFFSGFLYGFSRKYSVEKCLRIGSICGGLCVASYELANGELSSDLIENEYERHYGA